MPTILLIAGWRVFFWANESSEPIHVHAEKGDMECKYWIDVDGFEIKEAVTYNMTPQSKREIKRIIYENFDYIVIEWNKFFTNSQSNG